MSIELDVQAYCHECPHFLPETKVETLHGDHPQRGRIVLTNTIVSCVYKEKCHQVYLYLKQFVLEEDTSIDAFLVGGGGGNSGLTSTVKKQKRRKSDEWI